MQYPNNDRDFSEMYREFDKIQDWLGNPMKLEIRKMC